MDDFSTFARDFGFRPQGKSAPMTQSKPSDTTTSSSSSSTFPEFDYDSIFKTSDNNNNNNNNNKSNYNNNNNRVSSPVYDKPVYDEDIFDGLPGVKSKSGILDNTYDENVFASMGDLNINNRNNNKSNNFDDLLGNLGRREKLESKSDKGSKGFDDLLQGFGGASSPPKSSSRLGSEFSQSQKTNVKSARPTTSMADDPFAALNPTSIPSNSSPKVFIDPLDEIGKLGNYANTTGKKASDSGPVFDDINPLDGFGKSAPAFSLGNSKEHDPSRPVSSDYRSQSRNKTEPVEIFDIPSVSTGSRKSVGQMASPSYVNPDFRERNAESPGSDEHLGSSDDAWLTVSEIPLFTQPTTAPPPSRPPPPIPGKHVKSESGFYNSNPRKKANEFSSYSSYPEYSQSAKPLNNNMGSPIDDLESFAMGKTRENNDESVNTYGSEDIDTNSSAAASAAAMKDAMDRAEAKFRHAKEVKERENAKTARNREPVQVDEQDMKDEQERENRENEERFLQEQEERRRVERERERAREEREKARQAVQRATREARERAAIEARERAAAETRRKSERAAVDRAQAEVRERAERAAVQRAQNEARERAAADAREKAEKAEREARERVNAEEREKAAAKTRADAEARRRSDRAAVDRVAAEARERAASAAWTNQRNNDNARMNQQQKNDNDLESFFSSRASSAPRPREPAADPLFQSTAGSEQSKRTSSVSTSANMKKTSSATSFVDDLSSIFGGTGSSGNFQEVEGETGERRKARLDRHQRTQERAAKALAEKNQRDLQSQREQEERSRFGESLDIEVKRWAAGKEGNLRALLSTLQYVLWPECGWTPVSLTDLITGASVKKVYRKATLCIHPDKVQQKGANFQQKYIAEKVFDLLKEAWNKFNSEELF